MTLQGIRVISDPIALQNQYYVYDCMINLEVSLRQYDYNYTTDPFH